MSLNFNHLAPIGGKLHIRGNDNTRLFSPPFHFDLRRPNAGFRSLFVPFPARLPARWLAAAAGRLTLLSGVGYVAAAYTVSRFLTRPRRRFAGQTPADLGLEFQRVSIPAEDGISLAGWVVEPKQPRGTIAMFHGMRSNREQFLSRIAFLAASGYRCVAVDHRAHGESGGKRISFGWYEARDVRGVARWIAQHHAAEPRFAFGVSMGAAAICFGGPECGWSGVILESVYADLKIAFKRRIGVKYPAWFAHVYPGVIWISQKRLRIRIEWVRPATAVARFSGIPVLGAAGTNDWLAPPCDLQEVMKATPCSAGTIVVPNAGHSDVFEKGGESYRERIIRFLESHG